MDRTKADDREIAEETVDGGTEETGSLEGKLPTIQRERPAGTELDLTALTSFVQTVIKPIGGRARVEFNSTTEGATLHEGNDLSLRDVHGVEVLADFGDVKDPLSISVLKATSSGLKSQREDTPLSFSGSIRSDLAIGADPTGFSKYLTAPITLENLERPLEIVSRGVSGALRAASEFRTISGETPIQWVRTSFDEKNVVRFLASRQSSRGSFWKGLREALAAPQPPWPPVAEIHQSAAGVSLRTANTDTVHTRLPLQRKEQQLYIDAFESAICQLMRR